MVKMKTTPSQDGMRNTTVSDYFRPVEETTKDKNKGKLSENEEIIEFLEGITNDNNNSNTKINQTEEATKLSKANTETTEEKDEREDARADKKTENKQGTNGSPDESDDKDKNKNKNPNKNNDNQEFHSNNGTEKATNTEGNTETTNSESALNQHANKFHLDGAIAAKRMEMEEENLEQTTKEAVKASINKYQDPLLDDVWSDKESLISVDETVGDAREKTEVTEAGKEN